ncbi:MAG: acyl-CoA synthetase [Rhodocyclaceae bacterium]|nr:acyl-CoA synthetase [Rhodocyclaceae bacterium]
MPALPLFAHPSPDSIVAWRHGRPVTRSSFVAHARALADTLPAGRHYLALCRDRYHFAVCLAAGLVSGRIGLMPSTFNAAVAAQLAEFADDCFVVTDGDGAPHGLPELRFPELPHGIGDEDVPAIDADQTVAWVFTSGSTGQPVPHRKHWGNLVRNVRGEAEQLGLGDSAFAILGTVPAQHMYGFESTVMLPLQSGGALAAAHPFFPAEVCAALAALPRPRLLVTTPFHLGNLLAVEASPPTADLLVSATAPLEPALAARAEATFGCPLLEVYGSTETSQLATRRTTRSDAWRLFPGVSLDRRDDAWWASGGHVEQPMPLADIVEAVDARHFRLVGRNADLVNVAGKRSSLAFLSRQLLTIDGVVDGAFFLPDDGSQLGRPAALAVAPGRSAAQLTGELRLRIDPVFLPRPLIIVDALPRNATGKLPRDACQALYRQHLGEQGQ